MAHNLDNENNAFDCSYEDYIMHSTNWYNEETYDSYYSIWDDMTVYKYDGPFNEIEDVRNHETSQSSPEFKLENEDKFIDKKIGKFNDDFLIETKKLQNKYNKRLFQKWRDEAEKPLELYKKTKRTRKPHAKFNMKQVLLDM
jgi:hypothetical protein